MKAIASLDRREFLKAALLASTQSRVARLWSAEPELLRLKYVIASSIYGNFPLSVILPEVRKAGSEYIDLWPKIWGTQREEVDAMGYDKFGELLQRNGVKLAMTTRFDLGPFKLEDEIPFLQKFGGRVIVTGSVKGLGGLKGSELRTEMDKFVEHMKPNLATAGKAGVTIAIENHAGTLLESPDAIRRLVESSRGWPLGIALSPYHLEQNAAMLAGLIRDLGEQLTIFYAWQYGMGCMKPMPPDEELMQLPGRGQLDFTPLLEALNSIRYTGWTEIFMHHTPRGMPTWPTGPQITADIIQSRQYLEALSKQLHA
jgi:sugar phosphate isomerase/epimerase